MPGDWHLHVRVARGLFVLGALESLAVLAGQAAFAPIEPLRFLGLAAVPVVLVVAIGVEILAVVERLHGHRATLWAGVLLASVGPHVAEGAGATLQPRALDQARNHANPVVLAIQQYAKDKGRLPESLGALVPRYLRAVPDSGLPFAPHFEWMYADGRARGDDPLACHPWLEPTEGHAPMGWLVVRRGGLGCDEAFGLAFTRAGPSGTWQKY